MEGNYEDPIEAIHRLSAQMIQWADNYKTYEPLLRYIDFLRAQPGTRAEVPLAEFNLSFCDGQIEATGFFDGWVPAHCTIVDWKTKSRSSYSRYAPKTEGDFRRTVQLAYYAAAARQAVGWEDVYVCHVNLLRQATPHMEVHGARLDGWYLDRVWEQMEDEIMPEYLDILGTEDVFDVDANVNACFNYGGCEHRAYCPGKQPKKRGLAGWLSVLAEEE